jgi:hypothetical protein
MEFIFVSEEIRVHKVVLVHENLEGTVIRIAEGHGDNIRINRHQKITCLDEPLLRNAINLSRDGSIQTPLVVVHDPSVLKLLRQARIVDATVLYETFKGGFQALDVHF